MRHSRLLPALAALVAAATAAPATAQPAVGFEDAAVHAVQFIDKSEGWAVGDDGTIWHSIDGGGTWERQKSGTRASLRSVHFLTPYTGWAVGRSELPGGGSVGVMLRTTDGGLTWEELGTNVLPGLHHVGFFDSKAGFACGDGSDAFPTGLFSTADGGKTWRPVPGPRLPGWRAADFQHSQHGAVVGAWGRLGTVRKGDFVEADVDPLAGRTVHAVRFGPQKAFAAGDGGALLASSDGGGRWGAMTTGLSPAALACCDFRCVAVQGAHVWVAGRPGSILLHSPDHGKTWEVVRTTIPCPVNGLFFLDENTGWLVGELGTIAGTTDGGKTWKVQRHGGQRAAAMFLHAHGRNTPLDAVAALGYGDGYLCGVVSVMAADPAAAAPKHASDPARLRAAVRLAGGLTAEAAWSFPLPAHADGLPPRDLMSSWDRAHGGKASEQLLRQAVLAVRMWQPEVLVTDVLATDANPADVLVLHAAKKAFDVAADPNTFPEQITELGLKPWAPKKLYALCPDDPTAPVKMDLTAFSKLLGDSARDVAEAGGRILTGEPAAGRRCFKLVAHRLPGSESHTNLMDGVTLARGGVARRAEPMAADLATTAERQKASQARRNLEGMAAADTDFGGAEKVLAALGVELKAMPDDTAARTAFAVGTLFARGGRWAEAREVFGLLTKTYVGHPLAIEAYRWLTRYHASTETRRRVEIQQKLAYKHVRFEPLPGNQVVVPAGGTSSTGKAAGFEDVYRLYSPDMILRWHQTCLDLEPQIGAFGPAYSRDPAAWLTFLAARRLVGRHADAEAVVRDYFKSNPAAAAMAPGRDPWRDCLAAELWLTDPTAFAAPPKPLGVCRSAETRPFLDGKLDDPCWADVKPVPLAVVSAAGDRAEEAKAFAEAYRTETKFSYDDKFLYVAVTCTHPAGQGVPPAAKRVRDADLTGHDRVDILLDMDRDYQTYYRFQIDHRGCLAEDCWGDRTWNPKYFVAFLPSDTGWTAEIAVPLAELTGDRPAHGRSWAMNAVRVVPGKGVQGWSGPADGTPRPEGMGLLRFQAN